MENYIVINGKKTELTKEQLEKLGIKPERNNPFDRVDLDEDYFVVRENGTTGPRIEIFEDFDDWHYDNINYFNNKEFAEQMSLKWLLNRELEKYAWDNEAEDGVWDGKNEHYGIMYDFTACRFSAGVTYCFKMPLATYFSNIEIAKNAIKDVIEPFMKEHPNFKW